MDRLKKIFYRGIFVLPGFIKGLISLTNDHARDLQNKHRFPTAIIDKGCMISETTSIGNNSHILDNTILNNCTIGKFSYISRNGLVQNTTIGNYCSIANNVTLGLGSHPVELFSTSPIFYRKKNTFGKDVIEKDIDFEEYKPINIGNDVWIGANAIVLDGVTIETGAIIASGAIVTKNIPAYAIVAGVPAKIIKHRFSPDKISTLLQSKWWENDPDKVQLPEEIQTNTHQ